MNSGREEIKINFCHVYSYSNMSKIGMIARINYYNNYGFNWEMHRSHRVMICLETMISVKYMKEDTFWCH